jgi:hypothetical protein
MNDNNNFTIVDNLSEIAIKILPRKLVDTLTILARIKGNEGIDDYLVRIIKNELYSIKGGGRGTSELGENIMEY